MHPLLYRFLPHLCPLCQSRSHTYLCHACQQDLPRNSPCCRVCALPLPQGQSLCGECLVTPKPYELCVCPLIYRHPLDHLMLRFKEQQPHTLGRAMLPFIMPVLDSVYGVRPWPQLLVPVPSHWRSRLRRGYNQAHALADQLQALTGIPVKPLVIRNSTSAPQKTLDRKTRFKNLRGAFACNSNLSGESIAVIDDVITTGATAELISECLAKAGAGEIHIWALARTPKPDGGY